MSWILTIGLWVIDKIKEYYQKHKREQKETLARTPRLQLHVGYAGGPPGWSYNVIISNQGDEPAHDICVYLPGIDGPACKIKFLPAQKQSYAYFVPLSDDSPLRKEPYSDLKACLVFKNKYGESFTFEYALIQTKRDDLLYNIELDQSKEPIFKH